MKVRKEIGYKSWHIRHSESICML